jgi:hypothetical protein
MAIIVRTERYRRGLFGWLFRIVFWVFNLITLAWVAAAFALQAASAKCAELPKYDIELHCKASTAIFASSQDFFTKACIETEQKSQSQIAKRLDRFSTETIKGCDALAGATVRGLVPDLCGMLALEIADRFLKGEIDILPVKN